MGFAYLGIGIGGTLVPLIATALTSAYGWRAALQILGVLMIAIALPFIWLVRDAPPEGGAYPAVARASAAEHAPAKTGAAAGSRTRSRTGWMFPLLLIGVTCSIGPFVPQIALAMPYGWHVAMQLLGVIMIAVALPFVWLVKDAPPEGVADPSVAEASATAHGPATAVAAVGSRPRIWTDWTFPLLLVGSMCSIGAVGGTMQNLKLFLSLDKAIAQGDVAGVLSLVLLGSIGGRLLMGVLADLFPKKFVMLGIYALVAVTVPLLYAAPSLTTLYLAAIAFGVGLGGDYMIIPLMAAELYGLARLGRVMGVVLTADGVAEALVPMGVGALRDHYGSYGPGFALLVGLAAVGALAVAALPRTLLDTRQPAPSPAAGATA